MILFCFSSQPLLFILLQFTTVTFYLTHPYSFPPLLV
jgi:hypothetical protein